MDLKAERIKIFFAEFISKAASRVDDCTIEREGDDQLVITFDDGSVLRVSFAVDKK